MKLADFSTATLHEAAGRKGALTSAIKPLDRMMHVYGPAFPVQCPAGDNLAIHRAIAVAEPGSVLIVDHEGSMEDGPFGDLLALSCQTRGLAGLVIYGCVRDSTTLISMKFPVFSVGISIKGTSKIHPGKIGEKIRIRDIEISCRDIIVGDADGVVVIPEKDLNSVYQRALTREQSETSIRNAILGGVSTLDLLNLR